MTDDESGNDSPEVASPKRRRAPKGEMRRAALLDAATVIFARNGYSSASMKDVAQLAGITTVGLTFRTRKRCSMPCWSAGISGWCRGSVN
jgi:hypothetical protein